MDIYGILSMIGGLVLFLYGIDALGAGLKKASGGHLEAILESLTSNKWRAMLVGALVTAMIQSSGATTVMVVGFVNSEIMSLAQGAGIILGANIGTTITAWLLSLTGISGGSFLLSMFKPSSFAPMLGLVGLIMMMFCKKDKQKDAGAILTSFAVLLIGMTMMADSASPLADDPGFTSILTKFSNPVLGVLAGLVITAILQSSSASIGILQAISTTGTLEYCEMIPILMGMNIGSAITGVISAIGASRNGRRAAWMQMLFCILKAVAFMLPFYALDALFNFAFMYKTVGPVNIAIFHTVFNIAAVLVAMPLSDYLVKLVINFIPVTLQEKEEGASREKLQILDERFLTSPSFALEQCRVTTNEMARYSQEAFLTASSLLTANGYSPEKAARVEQLERTVDEYEDRLNSYLVKLSGRISSRKDSHTLSTLLHCINDFERIADHALNIMQTASDMDQRGLALSTLAQEELAVFTSAVSDILERACKSFWNHDLVTAKTVEPLEEVIDGINMEVKRRHVRRLLKGICTIEQGLSLTDITTSYERIADHCSNIAVCLLQIDEDGFDTHEYLGHVWNNDNVEFRSMAVMFETMYKLPGQKEDELFEKEDTSAEESESQADSLSASDDIPAGDQTAAGRKTSAGEQAVAGKKTSAGEQAVAGKKTSAGEQAVAGKKTSADAQQSSPENKGKRSSEKEAKSKKKKKKK